MDGLLELSDLEIETVGLVRRGANRKPFYFIKSEAGMAEENTQQDERLNAILEKLSGLEEMSEKIEVLKGLVADAQPKINPEDFASLSADERKMVSALLRAMGGKLPDPVKNALQSMTGGGGEESTDDEPDEFSERLRAVEEKFAAKLAEAEGKREKFAEMFASERRKRRLAEFSDVVNRDYGALGVKTEQFAEDLLTLADYNDELYQRLAQTLKAANEQVKQGGLFAQYSQAGDVGEASGGAFEREVERVRREKFSGEDYAEGYAKAMNIVGVEKPDLVLQYMEERRNG